MIDCKRRDIKHEATPIITPVTKIRKVEQCMFKQCFSGQYSRTVSLRPGTIIERRRQKRYTARIFHDVLEAQPASRASETLRCIRKQDKGKSILRDSLFLGRP